MSKRGGASDVNGFVSFDSEQKTKRGKKIEDASLKKRSEETISKKWITAKDPSSSTTSRTRVNEETSKNLLSKASDKTKQVTQSKIKSEPVPPRMTVAKKEISLAKPTKGTVENKKTTSSSRTSLKSNTKVSLSSPYIKTSEAITKPKVVKSNSTLKRQLSNEHKSTPLKKVLPFASTQASGDKRKPSQLSSSQSKLKTSQAIQSPIMGTKKFAVPEKSKTSKTSSKILTNLSPSKSKSFEKKSIEKIPLKDTDVSKAIQQLSPIHEVHRSNTFTKEDSSLNSDKNVETADQPQDSGLVTSDMDEYNYEDDFEDYESDFEEYTGSESSSSESEDEDEDDDSSISNDSSEEIEIQDEYKAGPSTEPDIPVDSEILQPSDSLTNSYNTSQPSTSTKDNQRTVKSASMEEERKLDSGSYDLRSHSDTRRNKTIEEIKAAMNNENTKALNQLENQKGRYQVEDEGFVEALSHDTLTANFVTTSSSNEGLINFENARKKHLVKKKKEKVEKRGTILMEMIRLDIMTYNHLDIPAVPYEVYMKCYGRSNTFQIHTQTNEDCITEEVQTDDIDMLTKWTQHPVKYSSHLSPENTIVAFSKERNGVGAEIITVENAPLLPRVNIDSLRFHNFINNAGEIILALLEDYQEQVYMETKNEGSKLDFGFSNSFTSLNIESIEFLRGRSVSIVCFSESNSSQILTVHKPSIEQPLTIQAESEGRCVICIWNIREPSLPLQMLVASNNITSTCFRSNLVFSGLIDGAICLWDLKEKSAIHCRSSIKTPTNLLRSPTYITADLEKGKCHLSSVISIEILPENNPDGSPSNNVHQTPTQMITLDEDGLLIIWTVVKMKSTINIDPGLAPWGSVRLIQSSQLQVLKAFPKSIQSSVQCRCLSVDRVKPSNLYIGTNCGEVVHCLQSSLKTNPQFYYSSNAERNTTVTCMDFSRSGHSLLMVGNSGGKIQVHRTMKEKPVLELNATQGSPIKVLQWSPVQSGLFFVLDAHSCIHVWNLCISDLCPQMSVSIPSQVITSMSVSPHKGSRLLAIGSESGSANIYSLKPEFGDLPKEVDNEQNRIFNQYITIL